MIKDFILDLLFPKRCVCGKWDTSMCEDCKKEFKKGIKQLCPICRKISLHGKTCASCKGGSSLTGVMILGEHKGKLKKFIWTYKYGFVKNLSESFSDILADIFGKFIKRKNFTLIPVPISKERKKWRGFNQSKLISESLAKTLSLSSADVLRRENRKPQVGLSRKERIQNARGSVYIAGKLNKKSKILLIDDVYTSGATLEECAKTLRKNGANEVWALVLSRE